MGNERAIKKHLPSLRLNSTQRAADATYFYANIDAL